MDPEHLVVTVISVFISFWFTPVMFIFGFVLILAATGKSLGLRRYYVKFLLNVFEYVTKTISRKQRERSSGDDSPQEMPDVSSEKRDNVFRLTEFGNEAPRANLTRNRSYATLRREFQLGDMCDFIHEGIQAVVDDAVTKRFTAEELESWNLLTRTNTQHQFISLRLTIIWCVGFMIRYLVLLPFRIMITVFGVVWLMGCTAIIGMLPEGRVKRILNWHSCLICYRILSRAFSAIITFHDREHRALPGGICVANHTSPIDVIILSADNCYAMIGQRHGGFTGMIQRAMSRSTSHVWFDRSETKDRHAVANRLRAHVALEHNLPMLIFPEGTCINNTSVMMFKKGSFEVGGTVYPVAIKYDPRFGDAFWNSARHNMIQYLLLMMSSWAIVVDVWYLPPMQMEEGEDAVHFANRVKAVIAKKGGLVDLEWDGMLKRARPGPYKKQMIQEQYSSQLKVE